MSITTRVRGMAQWEPRAPTIKLLGIVRSILVEYRNYLPMTVRQIFYRLVGAHGYDKTEQAYARLGEHLNRARRAGLIEFDAIRDDGSDIQTKVGWDNAADLIATWRNDAETFRLDRQQGQSQRLLFMVEAAGMQPMVAGFTAPFSIPVIPSGGFDSTTAKYRLAVALGKHSRPTEVLHIGDRDPSGVHLFSSMAEDVDALIRDLTLPGEVHFTRLAVTPQQVAELGLPTAPPKTTDRRSFEGETTQAESLPPDVLAQIVTDAITDRLDPSAYAAVLARESAIREGLVGTLDRLLGEDDAEGRT